MSGTQIERTLLLSRPAAVGALAFALVLLIGAGTLLLLNAEGASSTRARATHSQTILADAARILAAVDEAGAAVRRHLLTQEDSALNAYHAARGRLVQDGRGLEQEFAGHPEGVNDLHTLRRAVDRRLEILDTALTARKDAGVLTALGLLEAEESRRLADDIHRAYAALQRMEFGHLGEGSAHVSTRMQMAQRIYIGIIILAIVLAATAAWLLSRRMRELEELINVCAWTRRVHWKGNWITFEEYLAKRFNLRCTHGISEEAMERLKAGGGEAMAFSSESNPAVPSTRTAAPMKVSPARVSGT